MRSGKRKVFSRVFCGKSIGMSLFEMANLNISAQYESRYLFI